MSKQVTIDGQLYEIKAWRNKSDLIASGDAKSKVAEMDARGLSAVILVKPVGGNIPKVAYVTRTGEYVF
jgi:hypothetical protein